MFGRRVFGPEAVPKAPPRELADPGRLPVTRGHLAAESPDNYWYSVTIAVTAINSVPKEVASYPGAGRSAPIPWTEGNVLIRSIETHQRRLWRRLRRAHVQASRYGGLRCDVASVPRMTDRAARRISIRTALLAGFCLTAGVSIVFFSVQRYVWMTGALEREEREQDLALARAVATGLDRFLENTRHVVDGLAAEVAAGQLLDKPSLLQETVENAVRRELAFDSLAVTDDAGTAVAIVPRVNAKGASNIGMRLSDRQWFKDAMAAAARPSFDVIFSRTNGRATIAVAAPIRWRGRITGVAAVGLDLEQLRRVVHEVDPARSDRLVVVDAHGRVIAHSSPEWEAGAHDLSGEQVFRGAQIQSQGTTDYYSLYTGTMRSAAFVRSRSGWVVWASRGPESART